MQDLNNDMEELFRRAAKDYYLLPADDDWNEVLPKLSAAIPANTLPSTQKRGGKKSTITLLVVLLSLVGSYVGSIHSNNTANLQKVKTQNSQYASSKLSTSLVDEIKSKTKDTENATIIDFHKKSHLTNSTSTAQLQTNRFMQTHFKVNFLNTKEKNGFLKSEEASSGLNEKKDLSKSEENKIFGQLDEIKKKPITIVANFDNNLQKKTVITDLYKIKPLDKSSRFQIGIYAGPQTNQVKNQGFGSADISGGIFVSERVGKKLFIETGMQVSEKNYSSNGIYFNMTELSSTMPSGMKLVSFQGKSQIFEIPINAKYDFAQKNNHSLFAIAGLSSYLLTKESNRYLAMVNGNEEKMVGNYSSNHKYFMASINIGLGYEYRINKGASLRVQPYIQIPIKGIGIGLIPVTSTGILLGISLPFPK